MSKCLRSFLKIKHFSVHADIFQFMPIILDILDLRNFLVDNIHLVYLCKRNKNKQCMIQNYRVYVKKNYCFFNNFTRPQIYCWSGMGLCGHDRPVKSYTNWLRITHFTSNFRKIPLMFCIFPFIFINSVKSHSFRFPKFDSPIMIIWYM